MAAKRSEASTGGQWNLSGVLYQLLVTLKTSLTATVDEVSLGRISAGARVVVEPVKGGDAQTYQNGLRTVDQIKIRRGTDPWTTRTVIEEVLPDLFRAFDDGTTPSRYRFITDNLEGTTTFSTLLGVVRTLAEQGRGPAHLDIAARPYSRRGGRIALRLGFGCR